MSAPLSLSPSARQAGLLLTAAFITFAVGAACMHSYTVFLVAFIEAFGWTRGESSIAYSVSQMISGATSPLVGILVDRLGPRRLVLMRVGRRFRWVGVGVRSAAGLTGVRAALPTPLTAGVGKPLRHTVGTVPPSMTNSAPWIAAARSDAR